MTDDELMTLVRGQRDKVPMSVPLEEIISRGRAVRTRRLIPGVAGVLAVATGAAIAVSALAPASQQTSTRTNHEATGQAGHHSTVQLAAWTVTKLAGGNISVTIRQLQDPAGLQGTLRADGIPASVTFDQLLNRGCEPYPGGTSDSSSQPSLLLKQVFPKPYQNLPVPPPSRALPATHAPTQYPPNPDSTIIVIDRSALPSNAGVQLAASPSAAAVLMPQLVYASSQCTGG